MVHTHIYTGTHLIIMSSCLLHGDQSPNFTKRNRDWIQYVKFSFGVCSHTYHGQWTTTPKSNILCTECTFSLHNCPVCQILWSGQALWLTKLMIAERLLVMSHWCEWCQLIEGRCAISKGICTLQLGGYLILNGHVISYKDLETRQIGVPKTVSWLTVIVDLEVGITLDMIMTSMENCVGTDSVMTRMRQPMLISKMYVWSPRHLEKPLILSTFVAENCICSNWITWFFLTQWNNGRAQNQSGLTKNWMWEIV